MAEFKTTAQGGAYLLREAECTDDDKYTSVAATRAGLRVSHSWGDVSFRYALTVEEGRALAVELLACADAHDAAPATVSDLKG